MYTGGNQMNWVRTPVAVQRKQMPWHFLSSPFIHIPIYYFFLQCECDLSLVSLQVASRSCFNFKSSVNIQSTWPLRIYEMCRMFYFLPLFCCCWDTHLIAFAVPTEKISFMYVLLWIFHVEISLYKLWYCLVLCVVVRFFFFGLMEERARVNEWVCVSACV